MQKLKHFLSRLGNAILNDLIGLTVKILAIAVGIALAILKFVTGFLMWGGLILGVLVWTGNVTWEENRVYIILGIIAFIARYLSSKIMKTS